MVTFDVETARADFPALSQSVHGKPLAYLDNAASAQKPKAVLEAMHNAYGRDTSNVHRGVHVLSQRATEGYENARESVRAFINAANEREVIFVRGCTEAINLVAMTWGRANIHEGDEIILSTLEHHANIVPWQMLAEQVGARIRVIPVDERGVLDQAAFEGFLNERTKLLAIGHISNALGTVNPVKEMAAKAHAMGAHVLIDGAQGVVHGPVDVKDLDADFYAFSGHKLYGPTGIGVLYGKEAILEAMPPWQGGGDMIETVSFEGTTYAPLPSKFEAGTPHIAGAIGLGAAIEYLNGIDLEGALAWEHELLGYAEAQLREITGLRIVGTAPGKAPVISFVMDGAHPHDVGTILDRFGVAVRTGHHCAQPLMARFEVPATARASISFYNNRADVDALVAGLRKTAEMFA